MHARHLAAAGLILAGFALLVPACIGSAESVDAEDPASTLTPAEPISEATQALQFCECSPESDWCFARGAGKVCRIGAIPCTAVPRSCGTFGNKPCVGWCL